MRLSKFAVSCLFVLGIALLNFLLSNRQLWQFQQGWKTIDFVEHLVIEESDFIYKGNGRSWDSAPVVVEDYKLVFFTVPKVACTTWKQLFRRIKGKKNWQTQERGLPHNPKNNGLTYLWDYSIDEATHIMTSPNYTRAIFVREPKERFLSAFLDKAVRAPDFIQQKCCKKRPPGCVQHAAQNLTNFLQLVEACANPHWNPQAERMEDKYWPYINFVGRSDNLEQDAKRLLQRIGAWDKYGVNGWGAKGTNSIFQKDVKPNQGHVTDAKSKVAQWYTTPEVERLVEGYYAADYASSIFNFTKRTTQSSSTVSAIPNSNPPRAVLEEPKDTKDIQPSSKEPEPGTAQVSPTPQTNQAPQRLVQKSDFIYKGNTRSWDSAPIVIEQYKLVFFAVPKAGCTTWKQLFRRIAGKRNWQTQERMLPHKPSTNGLRYLWHYSREEANHIMTSPNYTRAIFVRDPKERLLSAFLDKVIGWPDYVNQKCCKERPPGCVEHASQNLTNFLQLAAVCQNEHWNPQADRMEDKYWKYIDFVGHSETAESDAKDLLQRIGAWEKYGASGWGADGTHSIFQRDVKPNQGHLTDAKSKLSQWFTSPEVERRVEEFYAADYKSALFNFTKTRLSSSATQ